MIRWMLTRMEKHPLAVFQERELESYDAAEFERLKSERLVGRRRGVREGDSYRDVSGRHLTVVAGPDGSLEAIDDEDPEFDAVSVEPADSGSWQVDMDAVCSRYRAGNQLAGDSGRLHDRLFLLGESSPDRVIILALLADERSGLPLLTSIPSLVSRAYSEFLVACPSFQISPPERRALESLGIGVVVIDERDPLVLPPWPALQGRDQPTQGAFDHTDDYRWVRFGTYESTQTESQATAVKVLHRAHLQGRPDVRWETIAANLESSPAKMSDVFKGQRGWQNLIVSRARGTYRLNL